MSDKHNAAKNLLAECRLHARGLLSLVDAIQAATDELERELGLADEKIQSERDQYLVLHYREKDTIGHPLSQCDESCDGDDIISQLTNECQGDTDVKNNDEM